MKQFLSVSLALLMTLGMLAGCGGSGGSGSAAAGETADLTFTTGGSQGTYYGFGSVLARYVSANTGVNITAVESGGSSANIEAMAGGEADLGFVQSDVLAYACEGTRLFEGEAADNISVAAALYMEQVQIVTTDPNIRSVADLKGRNVSIGAAGSGVYFNAIDVLAAYGLGETDITATYQNFGDSADALQDGKIDAAFVVSGAPTAAITVLANVKDVYLVSLDDEHIDKLIAGSPYYTRHVIPAGTYEGLDTDVSTVAVAAVVAAGDGVSEDAVYQTVSAIFENTAEIARQYPKGSELDLEFAASMTSAPYHPGAARYFAEKGITVPTK